jgi:hypothetical protein
LSSALVRGNCKGLDLQMRIEKTATRQIENRKSKFEKAVGLTGLEPVTLRLSSACSNQLSYRPGSRLCREIFEFRLPIFDFVSWRASRAFT